VGESHPPPIFPSMAGARYARNGVFGANGGEGNGCSVTDFHHADCLQEGEAATSAQVAARLSISRALPCLERKNSSQSDYRRTLIGREECRSFSSAEEDSPRSL